MTSRLLKIAAVGTALVFAISFVPLTVFAEEAGDSEVTTTSDTNKSRGEELKSQLQELKQQRMEEKQARLEAAKLKACENREARIEAIMARSITRAEKQLALFTTIAERVKAFYAEKGRVVANYDELVAAVDDAKAEAEANLETLKILEFDCSAEDPKGDVEAFKLALKSINQDLKDYRTSVKNLIVGVKSAQSTAAQQENGGEE